MRKRLSLCLLIALASAAVSAQKPAEPSSLPARAKRYAVMDMKGQVVSTGTLDNKDTRVKVQTTGSYVVKVGLGYRRVNVK